MDLDLPGYQAACLSLGRGSFQAAREGEAPCASTNAELHRTGPGWARLAQLDHDTAARIVSAVDRAHEAGFPAVSAWQAEPVRGFAAWAAEAVGQATGMNWRVLPAVFCWRNEPGERGWDLHRDRPAFTFDAHGRPILVTVWAAACGGEVGTGGVRVVPYSSDTGSLTKSQYERADIVTREYGVYVWNHAVLHEGTEVLRDRRVALAVELVREDYAGAAAWDPTQVDVDWTGLTLFAMSRYLNHTGALPERVRDLVRQWNNTARLMGSELGGAFDRDEGWVNSLSPEVRHTVQRVRMGLRRPTPILWRPTG